MDYKLSLAVLLLIINLSYLYAVPNIVRVALTKGTAMQAGALGQPVTSFYTYLDVGSPPKPFRMLIDIDSRETWLPHHVVLGGLIFKRLHYDIGYSKKASSSSVKEDREVSFEYQKCKLEGKPYQDYFEFKNVTESLNRVGLTQQFLAISSASNDRFSDLPIDGVLGLHPQTKSEAGIFSILISLSQQKHIDNLVFSLWLSDQGGEITFGGINPTKAIGSIKYHGLVPLFQGWELPVQSILLGAQPISCHPVGCVAALSTGVNDIYGPPDDVRKIMELLGVANKNKDNRSLVEIDCLRVVDLPTLTFTIDGTAYRMTPTSYVKRMVDGMIFKTSTCYVAILPGDSQSHWTLGTNFLSNYYSIFDLNSRQVGFAEKKTV